MRDVLIEVLRQVGFAVDVVPVEVVGDIVLDEVAIELNYWRT